MIYKNEIYDRRSIVSWIPFWCKPSTLGSQALDTNNTVSFGSETKDQAIVGDFANMFKWGYSKEIPLKIIEFGDPDNSGRDYKDIIKCIFVLKSLWDGES